MRHSRWNYLDFVYTYYDMNNNKNNYLSTRLIFLSHSRDCTRYVIIPPHKSDKISKYNSFKINIRLIILLHV